MKSHSYDPISCPLGRLLAVSLIVILSASTIGAGELFLIPQEQPVVPAYARLTTVSELGFTDRQWFVIPFYRDPSCIPRKFNLLEFFDRPRAWECDEEMPPYVEGFVIRSEPPPAPPEHFFLNGTEGMPVWFVDWHELQDVVADNEGTLTIVDLQRMDSLRKGVADFYMEELQTDANPVSSHRIVTFGELEDGTPFMASYSHGSATDVPKIQARIEFGE